MMTTKNRKVVAIALVLVALVSIFVPVASATRETWYLNADIPSGTLSKSAPGSSSAGLPEATLTSWSAGQAQCALTIGAGMWTLDLDYTAPNGGGTVDIMVYRYRETGGNVKIAEANDVSLSAGSHTTGDVDMEGISVDFAESGDYLLLWLTWTHPSGSEDLTINCGSGKSTFKTPDSDPGFPVPELSSLALFSIGLLALVGYVVYRRKNI